MRQVKFHTWPGCGPAPLCPGQLESDKMVGWQWHLLEARAPHSVIEDLLACWLGTVKSPLTSKTWLTLEQTERTLAIAYQLRCSFICMNRYRDQIVHGV